jgi:hypothetical protein
MRPYADTDMSDLADAELLRLLVLGDAAYREAERRGLIREKERPEKAALVIDIYREET